MDTFWLKYCYFLFNLFNFSIFFIVSFIQAQTNISILYNEDILQHPKHCSLATAISADLDNQLEHDAISRFQRKFGRYDEVMRQGKKPICNPVLI